MDRQYNYCQGLSQNWPSLVPNTIECRYDAVQYCKILHKWLQEYRQNTNQMLGPHKNTPYLSGELWFVFCECLWEKWPRYNGTALYVYITTIKFMAVLYDFDTRCSTSLLSVTIFVDGLPFLPYIRYFYLCWIMRSFERKNMQGNDYSSSWFALQLIWLRRLLNLVNLIFYMVVSKMSLVLPWQPPADNNVCFC